MSLTSALKDSASPLGQFVAARLANATPIREDWKARVGDRPTLRPQDEAGGPRVPWPTIGTAIDYRIRYYFAVTRPADLVAVHGGMWLIGAASPVIDLTDGDAAVREIAFHDPDDLGELASEEARIAAALARPLVEHVTALTERLTPVGRRLAPDDEAELCRICYALALYEELYRAGPGIGSPLYGLPVGATLADLLGLARPVIVDDLCRLSWAFYDGQTELIGQPAVLDPTFVGSSDVDGADADLIVGGCLVDIKTTVNAVPLKPLDLSQVVSYALLDYDDEYAIESVGIYLARQALLVRWPLADLVSVLTDGRSSVEALRRDLRTALAPG